MWDFPARPPTASASNQSLGSTMATPSPLRHSSDLEATASAPRVISAEYCQAEKHYAAILDVRPDHLTHCTYSGAANQQGKRADALRLIDAALKITRIRSALCNFGAVLNALDRHDKLSSLTGCSPSTPAISRPFARAARSWPLVLCSRFRPGAPSSRSSRCARLPRQRWCASIVWRRCNLRPGDCIKADNVRAYQSRQYADAARSRRRGAASFDS